jgi:hypothetical protein
MTRRRSWTLLILGIVLATPAQACGTPGSADAATPAPVLLTATATKTVAPTATRQPTSTPLPSATPDIAATQEIEDAQANIRRYVDQGYLPDGAGAFYPLPDFREELAEINYFDYGDTGYYDPVLDFAVWGDVNWSSAATVHYPEDSGCGFGFRLRDNGDGYTIALANERILFLSCNEALWGNECPVLGKTSGTGKVAFDNPAQARLELVVSRGQAYVMVDNEFIGEYTLYQDRLIEPGYLAYSIISGTNKDYGTRCEITNAGLWVPNP